MLEKIPKRKQKFTEDRKDKNKSRRNEKIRKNRRDKQKNKYD